MKRSDPFRSGSGAWLVMTMLLLGLTATAAADNGIASLKEAGKAFSEVAKKVSPAVVFISTEKLEDVRMRGNGALADNIRTMIRAAVTKYGLNRRIPQPSNSAFRRISRSQPELF